MNFGKQIKKQRMEKGVTQENLAKKLGYKNNSYISRVEKGDFIPSKEKIKIIAKTLRIPIRDLNKYLSISKIRDLGIKKPELITLVQDIPKLSEKEKNIIIKVYLKIKERKV